MPNLRVTIFERLKRDEKWTLVPARIPERRKPDGSLYLRDQRRGKFLLSWYEGSRRRYQPVKAGDLESARYQAEQKEHYLLTVAKGMDVEDPTVDSPRLALPTAIEEYFSQLTGRPKTKALHKQNLREFQRWTSLTYVDEITKPHLLEFKQWLIAGGNAPLTASWKLLRVSTLKRFTLTKNALSAEVAGIRLSIGTPREIAPGWSAIRKLAINGLPGKLTQAAFRRTHMSHNQPYRS